MTNILRVFNYVFIVAAKSSTREVALLPVYQRTAKDNWVVCCRNEGGGGGKMIK